MSGIGGIMNIEGYGVDIEKLRKMSLAMSLRGRKRSTLFYDGRVGMIFNSSSPDAFSKSEDRQPNICSRRGHSFAICIDSSGLTSSSVIEKYLLCGVEALGALEGEFALAIYDGERDMLLLARDKRGRRPLFYSYDGRMLCFSSDVKAITEAKEGYGQIDRDILARHLTSPVGIYCASDIYCSVKQILPGECILFTSMGMSRFFYREARDIAKVKSRSSAARNRVILPYAQLGSSEIIECLNEALIAFDYPQFDCYMPSVCAMLAAALKEGRESVLFEDAIRPRNMSYAYEREDRLGNLYGICARGILPKKPSDDISEAVEKMRELLYSKFKQT